MTRTLGKGVNPGYRSGSHWATCDRCGFEFRSEELKLEWTGLWVCEADFENRHEQDFLRVKEEKIAADEPLRPAQDDNVADTAVETTLAARRAANPECFTVPDGTNDNEI